MLLDRRLLAYIACTLLFHLANAAMLPLAGVEITKRADEHASLIIAACILVPQLRGSAIAAGGPVGRALGAADGAVDRVLRVAGAGDFAGGGHRSPVDRAGAGPGWVGRGDVRGRDAPGCGDMSADHGRFNLRMGILGLAIGVAATISNTVAGAIATELGTQTAFSALALAGFCAVLTVAFAMPETRAPRAFDEAAMGVSAAQPTRPGRRRR